MDEEKSFKVKSLKDVKEKLEGKKIYIVPINQRSGRSYTKHSYANGCVYEFSIRNKKVIYREDNSRYERQTTVKVLKAFLFSEDEKFLCNFSKF